MKNDELDILDKIGINKIRKNKVSGEIVKYLTRNLYLHIKHCKKHTQYNHVLHYLYYIDKDNIRKHVDLNFSPETSNKIFVKFKDHDYYSSAVMNPIASNIVYFGNLTWLYYQTSIDKGMHTIDLYFIGPNRYFERRKMINIINKYTLFRRTKREKLRSKIVVFNYSTGRSTNTIPIKHDIDIVSKKKSILIDSILKWNDNIEWYKLHNIIHKYGILLWGPPGTGKSSMISYIATVTNRNIQNLDLSEPLDNIKSVRLDEDTELKYLIVIEDIDLSLNTQNKSDEQKQIVEDKINWLMQFLDGTLSVDDTIVIMTTNNRDALDSRLLRPSRIDLDIKLDNFDRDEMKEMCENFNVNIDDVIEPSVTEIGPVELRSKIYDYLFSDKSITYKEVTNENTTI